MVDTWYLPSDWSPLILLDAVAASGAHALIDNGALVTGFSNEEVARYLLSRLGLPFKAVCFLDDQDRKMVVAKAEEGRSSGGKPVPLDAAGIKMSERFTFYDQSHTTGMDIKQPTTCEAICTISKDTSWRDFAQAAYRMRGIGNGQRIRVAIIPECSRLIAGMAGKSSDETTDLGDLAAWLYQNGFSTEAAQFRLLAVQTISNTWRKRAFRTMLSNLSSKKAASETTVRPCVEVFVEAIDLAVPNTTESPLNIISKLEAEVGARRERWLRDDPDALKVVEDMLDRVRRQYESQSEGDEQAALEDEKEEEGEEEAEEEQQQEQEQEQEQEQVMSACAIVAKCMNNLTNEHAYAQLRNKNRRWRSRCPAIIPVKGKQKRHGRSSSCANQMPVSYHSGPGTLVRNP